MKITRKKEFEPFTIKVKVESEEELAMLKTMSLLDVSIPGIMSIDPDSIFTEEDVEDFLNKLKEVL